MILTMMLLDTVTDWSSMHIMITAPLELYAKIKVHYTIHKCIVSIYSYSASCSAHQSEALPVRETQREERSFERTKRGTWLTS